MRIIKIGNQEKGFTIIELLTVIIIIGILAAVTIPIYSSQRGRAQDSQSISDVRNIVTFAETYLSNPANNVSGLSQASLDYASSKNVLWDIKGNTATNGYCVAAYNRSGKTYNTTAALLTYDSTGGGLKQTSSSCTGTGNTPVPTQSTAVGSLVVSTPTVSSAAVNTAAQEYVISGNNLGSKAPYNGTSDSLWINNTTQGWQAGRTGNVYGVNVTSWTDNSITIAGITGGSVFNGDSATITIKNNDGTLITTPLSQAPVFYGTYSVSTRNYSVTGNGFGTGVTYTNSTGPVSIYNATRNWAAGAPGNTWYNSVTSWSNTQVTGNLPSPASSNVSVGDVLIVYVNNTTTNKTLAVKVIAQN